MRFWQKFSTASTAALPLLGLLALGCAHKIEPGTPPEQWYEQLLRDYKVHETGSWGAKFTVRSTEDIRRQLSELRLEYPFSRYAVEAELLAADLYFLESQYPEAEVAYRTFYKNHPTHPQAGYALLRQARCFEGQAPRRTLSWLLDDELSRDREQSSTLSAYVLAGEVIEKYPDSEWAKEARELRRRLADVLAGHELFVGHYYFRFDHYGAAAGRFATARERYPESHRYGEATFYLGRSLQEQGEREQARILFETVLGLPTESFPQAAEISPFERAWAMLRDPELLTHANSGEDFWKERTRRYLKRLDGAPRPAATSPENDAQAEGS